jgi:uncharacterized GH25 family protein
MAPSRKAAVTAAALGVLATASLAAAHDTWLRAESGAVPPGATVTLHLTSGEGFATDDFAIDRTRLREASVRTGTSKAALVPVSGGEKPGGAGALLFRAHLGASGIATAWVRLAPKRLTLDSAKQVEYLEDIQATEAVRSRWRTMPSPRQWRESYVKHAKTFVRVGTPPAGDSSWRVPIGLTLEILPGRDPTTLRAGDRLSVRVLRRGAAIAGMPIGAVRDGETRGEWHVTDATGRATFTLGRAGEWLIHGTDLRPASAGGLEWESDFTTLTLHVSGGG